MPLIAWGPGLGVGVGDGVGVGVGVGLGAGVGGAGVGFAAGVVLAPEPDEGVDPGEVPAAAARFVEPADGLAVPPQPENSKPSAENDPARTALPKRVRANCIVPPKTFWRLSNERRQSH